MVGISQVPCVEVGRSRGQKVGSGGRVLPGLTSPAHRAEERARQTRGENSSRFVQSLGITCNHVAFLPKPCPERPRWAGWGPRSPEGLRHSGGVGVGSSGEGADTGPQAPVSWPRPPGKGGHQDQAARLGAVAQEEGPGAGLGATGAPESSTERAPGGGGWGRGPGDARRAARQVEEARAGEGQPRGGQRGLDSRGPSV